VARERQARRQLRDAADALRPLLDPGTSVEFNIDPRTGVDALLDESTTAQLIVLQRRELSTLGRVTAGSTSSAVAGRAHCPVAVTRTGLSSTHQRTGVVVGVDGQAGSAAAVHLAFTRAAVQRAQLTAIQVLPEGDSVSGHFSWGAPKAPTAAPRRATSALGDLINRYAGSFPEVFVAQVVVAGEAVAALLVATAAAELLVIGRHNGSERDGRNLGSVARQLINTARCPTLVALPIQPGARDDWSRSGSVSDERQQSSTASPR
jgi:nucleotide-binding universal stress UspA family protein